jgi:hypothetical protein
LFPSTLNLEQTGKTVKEYVIPDTGIYSTYSTVPCSTALVEKLTVPHLIKKFPAFYGTNGLITVVDDSHFQSNKSIHAFSSHFFKIHFHVITPPKLTSSVIYVLEVYVFLFSAVLNVFLISRRGAFSVCEHRRRLPATEFGRECTE